MIPDYPVQILRKDEADDRVPAFDYISIVTVRLIRLVRTWL